MMGNMGGTMNAPVNTDAAVLNALLTPAAPQGACSVIYLFLILWFIVLGGGTNANEPRMPGLMPSMPSGLPTSNASPQGPKKDRKDD